MNILISGGSGFLGKALSDELLKNPNNKITWLSRNSLTNHDIPVISYDELNNQSNDELRFDVIINLAGAGVIDKRWSDKQKQYLRGSRITPTNFILNFINKSQCKPKLLISSSAIGWYGIQHDNEILNEDSQFLTNDFAHQLCDEWENLAKTCPIPTVIIRTGIVMDLTGGMILRVLPSFKLGFGGRLGDGRQMMSWISLMDWVRAVIFIMDKNINNQSIINTYKIYNLTAPNAINNQQFTQILGDYLHRPTIVNLPKIVIEWLFGERALLLLKGQNVYPRALLNDGFKFKHNYFNESLRS